MAKYKKRKDGRYKTSVTVGKDWETGKTIKIQICAKTIQELEGKKANVVSDYNNGRNMITKKVMFKEYAIKWLSNKKPHVEHATYLMYESTIRLHTSQISACNIKEISKSDIQELINSKMDKPRTCKKIKVTLNQIFESALDDNICLRNPCKNVILPKYEPAKKRPLTSFEDTLSNITEFSDRENAFVLLMKWCGLRPEEVLALMKTDFNLENKTVTITNAIEFINNRPHIKETKTKKSKRTIPLIGACQTFIPYYLSNLSTDYLFTSVTTQELITDSSYRRMWQTIIRKMNKKAKELKLEEDASNLTPYIFRHNYATILARLNVSDREIQYLMGHTSIQTTNNWYIHMDPSNLKATQILDKYASKMVTS